MSIRNRKKENRNDAKQNDVTNSITILLTYSYLIHTYIHIILVMQIQASDVNGHSLMLPDECGHSWPYKTEL